MLEQNAYIIDVFRTFPVLTSLLLQLQLIAEFVVTETDR